MNARLVIAGFPLLLLACVSSNGNPLAPDVDSGLPAEDSGLPATDATLPSDAAAEASAHDSSIGDTSIGDTSIGDTSIAETSTTDASDASEAVDAADADTADAADASDASDAGVDSGLGTVAVTVSNDVGHESGVMVLFQSASGAVTGTATTDVNGSASAEVAAGSQVTVVLGPAGSPGALVTVQGVEPGDALTILDTVNLAYPTTSSAASVTIESIPDGGFPSSLTGYGVSAGACLGSTGVVFPDTFTVGGWPCETDGLFPLLVTAHDESGEEYGYAYQKANVLVDGGTDIAFSAPWQAGELSQTLSATNVSPTAQDIWFTFSEVAGGVETGTSTYYGATEDGGVLSGNLVFPSHPGFTEGLQGESVEKSYMGSVNRYTFVSIATREGAPDASSAMPFDMSTVLPTITSASSDSTDAGTPSAPALTWSSTASLATTDGLVLLAYGDLATDAGSTSIPWTLVAPPTSTSVSPPALPPSLGTWTVQGGQPAVVVAAEATFISGYSQFRTVAGALPLTATIVDSNVGQVTPPLPVDGTMRMTALTPGD